MRGKRLPRLEDRDERVQLRVEPLDLAGAGFDQLSGGRICINLIAGQNESEVEGDGRHFSALIVSPAFEGKPRVARHQLVYAALGELGVTFIKAGQTLSTRADLIPAEFAEELSKLQDQAPPARSPRWPGSASASA